MLFKNFFVAMSLLISTPLAFATAEIQLGDYSNSHMVTNMEGEEISAENTLKISAVPNEASLRKVQIYILADGGHSCSVDEVFKVNKQGELEFILKVEDFDNQICDLTIQTQANGKLMVLDMDNNCQIEMCGRASLDRATFSKVRMK